jgi:hypothetical protein
MRRVPRVLLLAVAVATAGGRIAAAQEPAAAAAPASQPRGFAHRFQGSLGVIVGTGYRGLVRYKDTVSCGDADKTLCTSRLPTFLDLQAGFGVTSGLATILDLRLGLEQDFTHSRPLALAPGIKYYIDAEERLKFFVTLQLSIDFTGGQLPGVPGTDLGLRNANGVQYDFTRFLGLWLQIGDTLAFRRYFRFELDVALGVEGRFPP